MEREGCKAREKRGWVRWVTFDSLRWVENWRALFIGVSCGERRGGERENEEEEEVGAVELQEREEDEITGKRAITASLVCTIDLILAVEF